MASAQPQKDVKPTGPGNDASKPDDATKKSPTALEEDDEFEDFPVEGSSTHSPYASLPTSCPPLPARSRGSSP